MGSSVNPSRRVLSSLPVGERVGIAFSGGLDTSAAVAWMRHHGAVPYCYTADLGQYDEHGHAPGCPTRAVRVRRRSIARLVDCRDELVREGLMALQCGAFHISSAGRSYFNTTPLGRAVTATMLVRAMGDDGVDIWGDGSAPTRATTSSASTGTGCSSTRRCGSTSRGSTPRFVGELGGRAEMSAFLAELGLPYRDAPRQGVLHRRQHLGCDARGQAAGATRRRDGRRRADHGRRPLGSDDVGDRGRGRRRFIPGGLADGHQRHRRSTRPSIW